LQLKWPFFSYVIFAVMKFRVARHTAGLPAIIHFYRDIAGLEILGSFDGHDGYDGVFIGIRDADWHLEFTFSRDMPMHHPDEDDLLVFYVKAEIELQAVREKFSRNGIIACEPKHPYWRTHGVLYKDPDGYGVLFALG